MTYIDNPYTDLLHKHPHQECVRCVMDTSDPLISFDDSGVCNHCQAYDRWASNAGSVEERRPKLLELATQLKERGKGKEYDCIMGLSGGVDSSYLTWFAVRELGLRPLVVHVDAGWNSELAVNNIQSIVEKLGLDLHTLVVDWEEIRDLQRAYFLAGIANLDVPQDHAFIASLYSEAKKFGIKDILNGGNMQTEAILPQSWGYDASDSTSLKAIHAKYGRVPLKNYPVLSPWSRYVANPLIARMRTHRPLEYLAYNKAEAKELLKQELGWRDYGGKHFESIFTKFFQAHYLPTKFGYDKRLAHLSSLIVSGQITKDEARAELDKPIYDPQELQEDTIYWTKKLGITMEEYARVMAEAPSCYTEFGNGEQTREVLGRFSRAASRAYRLIRPRKG